MKRRILPFVLVLLAPSLAFADPPKAGGGDPAAAQVLFYDARQLMEKGKYVEACPKLEESLRLDDGLGTRFNLADCNEHIGKIATAWAAFLEVAAESKAANQPDREKLARKRAATLEPRLPKVVVDMPSTLQGAEVKRDGVVIGPAAWATPIPVDAGSHRIVVSTPGKQWETTVQVAEGKTTRVAVPRELPAAPAAAIVPTPTPPVGVVPSVAPVERTVPPEGASTYFPPPVVEGSGSTQRALGWVIAGVGVAGIGVAGAFGIASIRKRDDSRSHCVVDLCDAEGVGMRDDALRSGNIATITGIAGGAALLGGIIIVLTAPKGGPERQGKARFVPTAAAGGGGFMLQGSFQ